MSFSTLDGRRVIITGANGFIGSHLAGRILKENSEVYIISRENSDLWRLEELLKEIHILKGDIRDEEFVNKTFKQVKPEYVFHIAAYGVDSRQKDYVVAASSNIIGTINLLNAAIRYEGKKFLGTGTSMQYGNKEGIIDEECKLTPNNIYGSSKAASTIISHQIAAENNLSIATLVPFGVFGEKEGSHKFFPHIILSALKNKDVELTLCEQFRDYCYIENIIDGFLLAAKNNLIKNEIMNIGSGTVNQLKYYVDMIFKHIPTDKKPMYGAIPYRKNDLWCPKPNISIIQALLGWEPQIALEDGVRRTIEWFSKNLDKYDVEGR